MYPLRSDSPWGKIFTLFILMIIPLVNIIGGLILWGYGLRIIREVMRGNPNLPELDLGGDITRGLMTFVIGLIYTLPVIIVGAILGALMLPTGTLTGLDELNNYFGTIGAYTAIVSILSIPFTFAAMVAIIRYANTEDFGVAMQIGRNISILLGNIGAVLMLLVNVILFGIIGGIMTGIGYALLVIPGIIMSMALVLGAFHMYAKFGMAAGLDGKAKVKNTF